MRWAKFFLPVLVCLLLSIPYALKTIHADDTPCTDPNQQQQCEQYISNLSQQLDAARGQEKTLKAQLDFIDGQTKLTQLKIADTNFQITKLNSEIDDLSGRITRLSANVDQLSAVLLNRIVETYKYGDITPIDLLFSSNGFSDLLERLKYIEVAQANDKKVLYQLQATKTAYNAQKQDKETRQAEQEKLQQQLQTYQQQLDEDKKAKDTLLRATQNSEAIYQSKLQAALAEQAAIAGILAGAGTEVDKGHVSQGTVIGFAISGASACSSGTHLHFEVHQNGTLQDPNNFLSSHSFSYVDNDGGADEGTINPHGNLPWPIDDPVMITQGYGMTPYAKLGFYGGGPHTGIDMYSPTSLEVKAVHDGELYQGGISCGGGTLHYFRIDDGDGTSIYYLHTV